MKKCFKCGIEKELSDFYKHPQMKDGTVNKCKECNKKDVKNNYTENIIKPGYIDKERKRGRQKYRRIYVGTGKANQDIQRKYEEKYPEKRSALLACQRLKNEGFEKHHWSYNEEHWKDIIWLTKRQHMKSHRFLVYDQERMMYRRCDTNELLDTKQKHENFIRWCIETKED